MAMGLIIALVLLFVIVAGLFYSPPAPYGMGLKFVALACAILLFLVAIGAMHL